MARKAAQRVSAASRTDDETAKATGSQSSNQGEIVCQWALASHGPILVQELLSSTQ